MAKKSARKKSTRRKSVPRKSGKGGARASGTTRRKRPVKRSPPPFYGKVTEAVAPARGGMDSEFAEAVQSGPAAPSRLRRFLEQYDPGNGEYEDGFQRNRVRAAQFELMRLEYLNGRVAAGDRLLARLQDVADA